MGLMDVLNGMQNGPRGAQAQRGGMSPWMMALLGLLAYKAMKNRGGLGNMLGGNAPAGGAPLPNSGTGGGLGGMLGGMFGGGGSASGGGLGGMLGGGGGGGLGGMLGGLLAGGAAGGLLNGGLRNLIGDMEQNGHGQAAQSWVSSGPNQSLDPGNLAKAIGYEDIDAVASQTGMSRDEVASQLSEHLPEFVNQLTPDGRLPTDDEASRWV